MQHFRVPAYGTDANGRYRFADLPPGWRYTVQVAEGRYRHAGTTALPQLAELALGGRPEYQPELMP